MKQLGFQPIFSWSELRARLYVRFVFGWPDEPIHQTTISGAEVERCCAAYRTNRSRYVHDHPPTTVSIIRKPNTHLPDLDRKVVGRWMDERGAYTRLPSSSDDSSSERQFNVRIFPLYPCISSESVKKINDVMRDSATTSLRKTEKFRVKPFAKILFCTTSLLAATVVLRPAIFAGVDPTTVYARAFALLAAEPYIKQGFQVREDYWTGELASGQRKAVRQQLFKGNEYWFWLGTEVDRAKLSVHIYDSDGKLAEQSDTWAKNHVAAAHIIPKSTGSYFIIVTVEESPAARTHWALAYGFR